MLLYYLSVTCLTVGFTPTSCQSSITNEIPTDRSTPIYWNVPTFQCDSHKLNFTHLARKYRLRQNAGDRFHGDVISILYDPGAFPAILPAHLRNGGLPQSGNLTLHLALFAALVDRLIPLGTFSGLAVIDFESWRPIFRQNFGALAAYRALSLEEARGRRRDAAQRFELHARRFMEETLARAQRLRPGARWGYYAYPYCFNVAAGGVRARCAGEVREENDRLGWLFERSDAFYPSLYTVRGRLSAKERVEVIVGRVEEANRVAGYVKSKRRTQPVIIPYFWYKYQDSREFLSKEDVFNAFLTLSTLQIDGLVLWGSSDDVNTKQKCIDLYNYIDQILGPTIENTFN